MMELYILRHGIAEESNPAGDAERALTDEGKRKLRRVLERAAKADVSPSLILSSPYKRARQTADIAAEVLGYNGRIVQIDALVPESSPANLWEEIRARRQEKSVLAAGHEPMLSSSVAWLLGSPAMRVDMKKGALVRIDIDQFGPKAQGVLRWLLTPKLAGAD
jgi:phosphohistidine phosphatase